jgi:GAF domain-containing protein
VSAQAVETLLMGRLASEAAGWLRAALLATAATATGAAIGGDEELWARWSGAGRRLGKAALALDAAELKALEAADAPFVPQGWGADECGRALILLAALGARRREQRTALVEDLYRTGELRERQALLRVLGALPEPDRFVALAVDAVRTNALPEIEALACENPYPARYFSEEAFNQMVLKCLFNGIALARIQGLSQRCGEELKRMVAAYAAERRAAGRPVPADAALVLEGGADAAL